MAEIILQLTDVTKSFTLGADEVQIIKGVSFKINRGDFVIIFGPSGCGKSTVLNMTLGLEPPSTGLINFLGKDFYASDDDGRAQIRKKEVGMVYQQSNWVKALNVLENVYFPLTLRGVAPAEREKRAWEMLKLVDMEKGGYQLPSELSSGQQQRISLARALITDPTLMNLFKQFHQSGKTVVMVTHDLEYLRYATRSINISDGLVLAEYSANDDRLSKMSVSKRGNLPDAIKKLT